jgi:hypothetical protein
MKRGGLMELLKKVAEKLENNNMQVFITETREEVYPLVKKLIPKDAVVSFGGSVTLSDTKVLDGLVNDGYKLLDRRVEGADVHKIYRDVFNADFYLSSSNAITENGELYNVDGNANRIAAIAFGPENVIIIAGKNKIVKNLDEAIRRVKEYVAPKNCVRLGLDTYCAKNGKCVSLNKENPEMSDGCASNSRICCDYIISSRQRIKDRIKVILVNEELGY